jgi:hypothetical protein
MSKSIRHRRGVRGHGQFLTSLFGFRPTSHRAALAAIVALVGNIVTVATAEAHGFGQRYDLPIPLAFYIVGAGLTVAFSFVLVALFFTAERVPRDYPHLLLHVPAHGWISRLALVVRAACAAYFLFLIVAGIAGDQNPFRNIVVVRSGSSAGSASRSLAHSWATSGD